MDTGEDVEPQDWMRDKLASLGAFGLVLGFLLLSPLMHWYSRLAEPIVVMLAGAVEIEDGVVITSLRARSIRAASGLICLIVESAGVWHAATNGWGSGWDVAACIAMPVPCAWLFACGWAFA